MARYSAKITKTTAATAGLWIAGLRCPTTSDARLWELHIFAESAAANAVELRRVTTAGTGAATSVVPVAEDVQGATATVVSDTAFATAAPAGAGVPLRGYALPATIGQGIIWQFPLGIVIPVSGAIGLFQLAATAVTYGVTWVFDQ